MIVLVHAAKGGVGTTTVAASLALADGRCPHLLVDLAGDLAAALGVDVPDSPGVVDWLRSDASPSRLEPLVVPATDHVEVLTASGAAAASRPTSIDGVDERRWSALAGWLLDRATVDRSRVVVDAGTEPIGAGLVDACTHRLLVTRRCYLSLRRSPSIPAPPTGVVLISESGRSLRRVDVERSIGVPIVADLAHDVAVANQIDAGLLQAGRPVRAQRRALLAAWRRILGDVDPARAA